MGLHAGLIPVGGDHLWPTSLTRTLDALEGRLPGSTLGARRSIASVVPNDDDELLRRSYWTGSLLTRRGFPIELAFTTTAPSSVRVTTEVSGPLMADTDRLDAAIGRLRADGTDVPPEIEAIVRRAQGPGPLRWGAWLGFREQTGGAMPKLYAEATGEDFNAVAPLVAGAESSNLPVDARMVGWDGSRFEVYGRLRQPILRDLWSICDVFDVRSAIPDMVAVLRRLVAAPGVRSGELPRMRMGISIAGERGRPSTVTVFVPSTALHGGDAAGAAISSLSQEREWELPGLDHLLEVGGARAVESLGLVGVAMAPGLDVVAGLGVGISADALSSHPSGR